MHNGGRSSGLAAPARVAFVSPCARMSGQLGEVLGRAEQDAEGITAIGESVHDGAHGPPVRTQIGVVELVPGVIPARREQRKRVPPVLPCRYPPNRRPPESGTV